MTIVDGRAIASDIKTVLQKKKAQLVQTPQLDVVSIGGDAVTQSFVRTKERYAHDIGVAFVTHELPADVTTEALVALITQIAETKTNGIVVQLPLPEHVDVDRVISAIPIHLDVDVLNGYSTESLYEAPVAAAVGEILARYNITLSEKKIVVIGKGRLVGLPVATFLTQRGGYVDAIDVTTPEDAVRTMLREADIVVSGVGVPRRVTPDLITPGVVLIDAGTSSSAGSIQGDIAEECATVATVFSPTPGGVGPITVAKLFENIIQSALKS